MTLIPPHVPALDIARAIAIVGVVLTHTWGSLVTSGIASSDGMFAVLNDAIVVMRMPALCFFIGVFIPSGVRKRGASAYVVARVTTLLWVYVVWFSLQGVLEVIMSPFKNTPRDWWFPLTLWDPYGHFWFLPFLALATTLVVWLRSWERPWALALLVAVGLITWGWRPPILGLDGIANVAFIAAGATAGKDRALRALTHHRGAVMSAGIIALAVYTALWPVGLVDARFGDGGEPLTRAVSMLGAFLGVPIVGALGVALAAVPVVGMGIAQHIGRGTSTIAIYAAHILAITSIRIVLELAGVPSSDAWIYWTACVVGGVVLPLALRRAADRLGARWLFAPPAWLAECTGRRPPRGAVTP